jgi:hypothetical protein
MHNAFMAEDWERLKEPHQRLRWARRKKGYRSAAAAAQAMRLNVETYRAHENGSRGFGAHAQRYATFFRVPLDWLLTGRGAPKGRSKVEELLEDLPPELLPQVVDYVEFLKRRGEPGK